MDSKLPPGSPKIDMCILDLSGKEKGSRREEKEDTWVLQNCSFSLLWVLKTWRQRHLATWCLLQPQCLTTTHKMQMPKTTPQLKIRTQETQKFIQCSKIEFQYLIPVPIHIPHSKAKAKRCQQCISSTFILWVHPRKRVHILSFNKHIPGSNQVQQHTAAKQFHFPHLL